jgi:hypothetical protein
MTVLAFSAIQLTVAILAEAMQDIGRRRRITVELLRDRRGLFSSSGAMLRRSRLRRRSDWFLLVFGTAIGVVVN